MPTDNERARAEDIRRETLQHLYERRPLAQDAPTIQRHVSRRLGETGAREIADALDFLQDLGFVDSERDTLGSTRYWRCTAAGVLHVERGG